MSSDESDVAILREEMRRETDEEQAATAAGEHNHGRQTSDGGMDRLTVRMPDEMIDEVDAQVEQGRYPHRTAAIRDAVRERFMRGGEFR